ncbi:MAG: phenylalanine--tRNA ligase subunit beta [Acidobacteriota bacterium]|nr:phenylalanine--tRNA ligase subunit beta [Acidobacteriota bacterium]
MRLVYPWLLELVAVPGDVEAVADAIALRGFEVAAVEHGPVPVIDFEITANRPDCLNHLGLAREAAAIWGLPLRLPEFAPVEGRAPGAGESVGVELDAPDLCPRYCAQVFDVRVGPSPEWLRVRLEAAGVRPINNVVDVTNYVMLEIGQPMHAFDLQRIEGRRIVVRRARSGERMHTLDGVERALDADMLAIADAERALAVAGVMGGRDSEISAETTRIVLESACFLPASVRRTSKRLALKTEASSRFERGGDVDAPPLGIARAAALFARVGGGTPIGSLIDRYPAPRPVMQLPLRASRIARVLGQEVPAADVPRFLEPLGFAVAPLAGLVAPHREWLVTVPSFRVDVVREADLIEEVGRHYGFDRLPMRFPALGAPQRAPDTRIGRDRNVRLALTAAGFSESMTFAFIERQAALPFCEPGVEPAALANPLSEKFAVLRPSLLPGLTDSCAHNRRRGRKDIQLFETGSRFTPDGEGRAAAFAWCGAATPLHWSAAARTVDFFDAKGAVELLCAALGVTAGAVAFSPSTHAWLVRGRAADVRSGALLLGSVGQLAPRIADARGFPSGEDIYVAEIDLDALSAASPDDALRAESLPRFPSIVRDVSLLVDEALPAAAVRGTIRSSAPQTLVSVVEFDRYQGKGVPAGRVSLSLRLTFRDPERTLTDEDAQHATDRILQALRAQHGAEQR